WLEVICAPLVPAAESGPACPTAYGIGEMSPSIDDGDLLSVECTADEPTRGAHAHVAVSRIDRRPAVAVLDQLQVQRRLNRPDGPASNTGRADPGPAQADLLVDFLFVDLLLHFLDAGDDCRLLRADRVRELVL